MSTDLDLMQGAWDIKTLVVDGNEMPSGMLQGSRIVVQGNAFTTTVMGKRLSVGTAVIDETANPRTFDLTFTDGMHIGQKSLAIYEFNGETWHVCIGLAGKPRPTAFVSTKDSGHALETLTRA